MNPIERLDAEDQLMTLISDCIRLGHPQKARMAGVTLTQLSRLSTERLVAMSERLTVWVAAATGARQLAAEAN